MNAQGKVMTDAQDSYRKHTSTVGPWLLESGTQLTYPEFLISEALVPDEVDLLDCSRSPQPRTVQLATHIGLLERGAVRVLDEEPSVEVAD